jgi:toxin ParE1/3/4
VARITRRPCAEQDLVDIWTYIADGNERAADKMLDRISAAASLLAGRPLAGRERPELAQGMRSFPVGNYVLFYQPVGGGIEVLRVCSRYLDLDPDDFDD